ncbi:MAG: 4Fe-4S binding protein [Firmicutes bacterium]|nr:4Fe-4S binding protein [Bacillota bacterium]
MKRKIIKIDEDRCNGCGLCIDSCHEGALQIVDGVARLVTDSYCDGLGACLPECPAGALAIEEREAEGFDEEAVKKHLQGMKARQPETLACGCAGTHVQAIERPIPIAFDLKPKVESELRQWPCQIKLVPVTAPYFDGADLLVAADCTAYAYANIHQDFIRGRVTLIGCPKLDQTEYAEKLGEILKRNQVKSVTVLRMEVPCCGGMVNSVRSALAASGREIPLDVVTIGIKGEVIG